MSAGRVRTWLSVARTRLSTQVVERSVAGARARAEDEVGRLLAAGREVLLESGYEGLRIDEVLRRAGLSTRAFYRHFESKAELFLALFDEESQRAGERLAQRVERAGTPEDQVRAWITAILALAYDHRLAHRARVFAGERGTLARLFPAEVELSASRQRAPLEAAIAAGRDAGVFPKADPPRDARAVHLLCTGLMGQRLEGTSPLSLDAAVALAAGFTLQALRAEGTGRAPARRPR
jgi:AcrR family transcriptional regulator